MKRAYFIGLYYLSWLLFAVFGVALNLLCILALPWAGRAGLARWGRGAIKCLFRLWTFWLHHTRIVRLRWVGFEGELTRGTVYVANHPCLVDATLLLPRLPETLCVLKPALLGNPAIGASARVAGYEPGDNVIDLVHRVAAALRGGCSLLIFPEGTRTQPGTVLGNFRNSFALVAARANAPVRLIAIRTSDGFVTRGRPWWKPPAVVPAWIQFELGPELRAADYAGAPALGQAAEQGIRTLLNGQVVSNL